MSMDVRTWSYFIKSFPSIDIVSKTRYLLLILYIHLTMTCIIIRRLKTVVHSIPIGHKECLVLLWRKLDLFYKPNVCQAYFLNFWYQKLCSYFFVQLKRCYVCQVDVFELMDFGIKLVPQKCCVWSSHNLTQIPATLVFVRYVSSVGTAQCVTQNQSRNYFGSGVDCMSRKMIHTHKYLCHTNTFSVFKSENAY